MKKTPLSQQPVEQRRVTTDTACMLPTFSPCIGQLQDAAEPGPPERILSAVSFLFDCRCSFYREGSFKY